MTRNHRSNVRIRQQGQTLIIALIVMGVLLVLGLVFIGLIDRNIVNAARSQRRSESTDLAEAGIRYAHGQLVSSPLGADWRGIPASLGAATTSRDPDIYYLRPGSGLVINPSNPQIKDLGGPDMLGPFVRVSFPNGRSLVRVRYGASDASPSAPVPGGPLRHPGAARSMLIIESVGRPGIVNQSDPTTLTGQPLQFAGFTDVPSLRAGIAAMAQANGQISTSRRLVAFAPIGIIDAARFETNVFNSSAPIELGIADGLGIVSYDPALGNSDVGSNLSMQLGTAGVNTLAGTTRGFGGMIINGDAKFFGLSTIYLNRVLGDSIRIAGRASGSNNAKLQIFDENATGTPTAVLSDGGGGGATGSFDSQDPNFDTASGLLLDGSPRTDQFGFPSGVGKLIPPSTLTIDPQTKLNRYISMTRESGLSTADGNNTGRFGYGQGIYVDNAGDRQEALDAEGRKTVGSQRSLFDDWLNPNSGAADSGWKGPFYVPRGAVIQLLPDGWTIQRDGSGPASERTWKRPDGTDSGASTIRYRVGLAPDGSLRTLNTFSVADINAKSLDYSQGTPFNGVLYFEGNVRVRGTIPTEVQMTIVSGATIYIDGSIVKGTTANEVTPPKYPGVQRDEPIPGLPTASLMLMAKDNVAVNTSMFFGPAAGQALESVNDVSGATGISPVRLRSGGGSESGRLDLLFDLGLDPNDPITGAPLGSAQLWKPFAVNYRQWNATGAGVPTQLLLGHTMDDGSAAASFLTMDVNFGTATASTYLFNAVDPDGLITNAAAAYAGLTAGATTPLYGLGSEPWQRYSRFELRAFDLLAQPTSATYSATNNRIDQSGGIDYKLFGGPNSLLMRPGSIASVSTNDTLIGRVAVTPADVKIEASIFAEQGSFFVIPGPWFNPNPNDRHDQYQARVAALTGQGLSATQANARAARERLEAYGAAPWVPFYGEPLDVRLSIVGSVAENLPPPISVQSEWVRKWGWIPRYIGAEIDSTTSNPIGIPKQHVPAGYDLTTHNFVPNLTIQYDPILATGRSPSYVPIRQDSFGRPLPPMPRLPVSPRLAYFGEL
jgi:type II secretory pathway pseudopilin PulG